MERTELTILMPCLNEVETIAVCVNKAAAFLRENNVRGEILVADNDSEDGSREIAEGLGARVITVAERGYGAALIGGCAAALGEFVIMGDADDSYDFSDLMPFLERLREGYDLVMGNRFKGGIEKGAMPPLHRYVGNPVLSAAGRLFYGGKVGDFHCGLRGYKTEAVRGLNLRTTGMEYASEMVVKATLNGLKITEVPVVLRPDGRSRPPHLNSGRDGWRHLKFLLMYAPDWFFLVHGAVLFVLGAVFTGALTITSDGIGAEFAVNRLVFAVLAAIVGANILSAYVIAKIYAEQSGYIPTGKYGFVRKLTAERGTIIGVALMLCGFAAAAAAFVLWRGTGFGAMKTGFLRVTLSSLALCAVGIQFITTSFLADIIRIKRDG